MRCIGGRSFIIYLSLFEGCVIQVSVKLLHLDFNLYSAGEFELHQSVDSLSGRTVDVDETLVGGNLELLAALLVDEGRAVHGEDTLARGEGNRSTDDCTRSLYVLHNLLGRLFYESVVVRLQFDSDFLTHLFCLCQKSPIGFAIDSRLYCKLLSYWSNGIAQMGLQESFCC